ncbi:DUF1109 domain-containing protein [Sphingomicrobium nitratireducens]|uniref:DUF1109 domain-containing protein n=1 Tax=Sphingomicrobium nitratireducens TaxID=2964666 RepID=UPI0022407160|nr:DUF1109 domain-containing protein [Sphingomicrobium nitratireducens]
MNDLLDRLADDVRPVRPLSLGHGRILAGTAALATIATVLVVFGVRPDLADGNPASLTLLVAGLFALLAVAAGWSATRLARPAVGGPQGGAHWVLAATLLLPAVSIVEFVSGSAGTMDVAFGLRCFAWGLASGLFTGVVLTHWLRRGATVLPEKAGTLVGLTAGAVGALAITLECSGSGLAHLGLWHVASVIVAALLGRVLVTPILRW